MDNDDKLTELVENACAAIGHEIHDSVLPLLFGASAILHREIERASNERPDIEPLEKATAWVDDAMRIGRSILSLTHSPGFDSDVNTVSWDQHVQSSLERILDAGAHSLWTLKIDVSDDAKTIAAPVATAAFRISVEAVRNAIRHGKATEVQITASVENNALHLSIGDNGSGFDVHAISQDRFGIRTMRGRAELVGGTLRLQSQPLAPTTVYFDCQLN